MFAGATVFTFIYAPCMLLKFKNGFYLIPHIRNSVLFMNDIEDLNTRLDGKWAIHYFINKII